VSTSREAIDGWCERGILALVLAILVFGPLATGAVRSLEFLIIQGLTLGVVVLWGARLWLNPRPRLLWPPICWAVVAFTLYAIARYLTADIEYVARQELMRVLVYAFLFFAILNNLHRQESTQIISFTLVFLAMAISFYAIYQFLTGSDHVWHFISPYKHRGSGTYICPNHLAGFLEMLLPLGLAYTLTGRLKPVTRILLGYAALVMLAGIAVTVSRGGWISTGLVLLLFFTVLLFHRNYRVPALVALVVLVTAGAFLLPRSEMFQRRLKQLVTEQGTVDDDARFSLWRPAVRVWQDHPWWGGGPAHFNYRFRVHRPEEVQVSPDWAHNDYLNTLADWGVAGATLVASAWVLLGLGISKTWRCVRGSSNDFGQQRGSNKFAFVLGASLGLTAILAHSVVDFNMQIPANAILAVSLMALLSGHLRFATERYWARLGAWAAVPVSVCLLAGLAYLGWQSWRHASEYVWLDRAQRAPAYSQAQIDFLTRAFAAEPMNANTAAAIGEAFRIQSLSGPDNSRELAEKALGWFERGMKLNPLDAHGFLHYGMCLDWLGRQAESGPYFDRAEQLDPNSHFILANIGLHYVSLGNYAAAKPWFERSLRLESKENILASSYLQIANSRLLEAATNDISARLYSLPR
jgi:O-antigen ligase